MVGFKFMNKPENKFYKVTEEDIIKAEQRMNISFPNDLKELYLEIGYGFIKGQSANAINRILGPATVADIRLREGNFEADPDLDEIYDDSNKLIFFEVNEGVYISIDLTIINRPVFYFDVQIAGSLKDFFEKFFINNEYYIDLIED
ncbi:SMI1/KNR4 family protein [Jeotgalibacillus sp. ET6]|uniref:SMI1/KNR4 family protein n=1 Tax=Jeotgalibacillus sp. ET6 TaxID=3037260 RepID=UPI0024189177|nr:SMI1/KNR4 family protein [Jeotgalibacillus sp. ET6]MDG5471378.1 SMI1/KNR4 family protein [Jeotgalibacillus sp. ET6]